MNGTLTKPSIRTKTYYTNANGELDLPKELLTYKIVLATNWVGVLTTSSMIQYTATQKIGGNSNVTVSTTATSEYFHITGLRETTQILVISQSL